MLTWTNDVRLALRTLQRRPGFVAMALGMLALGIGCTTALFGVFRTVFLQPLPLPEPEQLTFIMERGSLGCCAPASGPDYADWVVRQRSFSGLGIINPSSVTLTGGGEAARVYATSASASVFQLLGVTPLLGRTITVADEVEPSVVVLSYGLWQRRFGGRAGILGTTVQIDQAPYTIIGVMPKEFDVPSPWLGTRHHQLYTPFERELLEGHRGSHSWPVVARLAEGTTLEEAQTDMDRVMRELAREYPVTNTDRAVRLFTAHEYMYGSAGRELAYILGAGLLVLLVACGNVAGLQLARTAGRETELAVRWALGASRAALIRVLLSESVVLATLGGVGGILVAFAAVGVLRAVLPPTMPRIAEAHVDGWALLFAVAASAFTAFVFGIVPSLVATGRDVAGELREGGHGTLAPAKQRARDYFIVAQIALGLVLANGAALLVRSYVRVRSQDMGFRADGVLAVGLQPSGGRYDDDAELSNYYDAVVERVHALPGIDAVGTVSRLPLDGGKNDHALIEGRPPRTNSDQGPLVEITSVTGDYFAAMGIELLRGRTLRSEDSASSAVNVVINHHLAEEAWPGADPLGKRFSFTDNPPQWLTVVGVVDDVRQWGMERPPVSQVYYPLTQGGTRSGYVVARTGGDPERVAPMVRRAIISVDPTQAPSDIRSMTERVDWVLAQRRFYTTLIGLFTVTALVLAGAGVYGTISYYVTRRRRDLGIRMALGATRPAIVGMVLRRGAQLTVSGVALGLLGVAASRTVVAKLLYGIGSLDPWTVGAGCLTLTLVVAAASAFPAARAVRIPPALALRSE